MCTRSLEVSSKSIYFGEVIAAVIEKRLDTTVLTVADIGIKVLFAMAQAQEMTFIDVQTGDFLEQLIQSLVAVGYQ